MYYRFFSLAIPALFAGYASSLAVADTANDVESDVKLWTGDVEFGYVSTSGNTEESTIKSKANITREKEAWRYTFVFDALNSQTSNERSAEKYFVSNRLAYAYSEHNYRFGYASYDDDRFSGYDYQATLAGGYGRRIFNDETMQWDVEIGPGYRYSKFDDSSTEEDSEEFIVRLFTNFVWDFSDNASFSQSFNVESGNDNTISKSVTALKSKINGHFAMKLSYSVKYSDTVPTGNKHADEETAVTLTYSF